MSRLALPPMLPLLPLQRVQAEINQKSYFLPLTARLTHTPASISVIYSRSPMQTDSNQGEEQGAYMNPMTAWVPKESTTRSGISIYTARATTIPRSRSLR